MYMWNNPVEPVIYSADAIDRDLKRILNLTYFNSPLFYTFFEIMYELGVRAGEAINIQLWKRTVNNTITLQPQKNNEKRIFDASIINSTFIDYIDNPDTFPSYVNYSRLNSEFRKYTMFHKIYVGDKSSSLHLFRHNFVKKLQVQGYTDIEIKEVMGERNLSSVASYTNSVYSNLPTL